MRNILLLFLLFLCFSFQKTFAQADLEAVPLTWSSTNGQLVEDTNHYRLGAKSVAWNWIANDTLKITDIKFNPSLLADFNFNTLDIGMYNTSYNPSDSVVIQLYDKFKRLRYNFTVRLNYKGWYEIIRSYRYDMPKPKGAPTSVDSITTAFIIAPKTGSGQLNFDNVNWIDDRKTTPISLMMPDNIIKTANSYPPYDDKTLYLLSANIPLNTPTASEIADWKKVKTSFLTDMPGAPSIAAKTKANSIFTTNGYMINSDGTVKGNPLFAYPQGAGGRFTDFTQTLQTFAYTWYNKKSDTVSLNKAIIMLRYLLDNGNYPGGCYKIGPYDALEFYTSLAALSDIIYSKDTVLFNDLSNYVKWQLKFGAAWMPPSIYSPLTTDNLREEITGYLVYPLFMIRDTATAIQHLKGFDQILSIFMQPNDGVEDNVKLDGSVFHHQANYYNYTEPLYCSLPKWLYHLRYTQFKPSFTTYKLIRDVVYNFFLEENTFSTTYGNKGESQQSSFKPAPSNLWRLALLSNGIIGSGYDPKIAGAYNRLFPKNPVAALPVSAYPAESFPTGFYQMNYATLGIYRKKNWLSTIKMFNSDYWGSECGLVGDNGQRRDVYSRYLAYGSMDIQYAGGLDSSGYTFNNYKYNNGYDHNFPNGTTTIVLPFDTLACNENYGKEYANTGSIAGSLSFQNRDTACSFNTRGEYGLSAMSFQQAPYAFQGGCRGPRRNTTFKFQKSWFAFDSIIVCLGSGITNNDKLYPTATSIFQLTDSAKTIYINGVANKTFPFTANYPGNTAYQLISPYSTGFYIKSKDSLKISVSKQQYVLLPDNIPTPSSGNWAKVWLDHGKNPSNKTYEYVVIPSTTPAALQQFADSMAVPTSAYYTVKQANASMHYVYYKPKNIQAFAIFKAITKVADTVSWVKSASAVCNIMVAEKNDTMQLAVSNPDVNLQTTTIRSSVLSGYISKSAVTPITITLKGKWSFLSNDSAISITGKTDSTTTLKVMTQYGLPYDAVLKKDSSIILDIKTVAPILSPNNVIKNEKLLVFPNPVLQSQALQIVYTSVQERKEMLLELIVIGSGKRVYSNKFNAKKGDNKLAIVADKLGKGTYLAKLSGSTSLSLQTKFLVK